MFKRLRAAIESGDADDKQASSERDRINCKKASAPISMQPGLEKPVCVECFDEENASLAALRSIYMPGYTNLPKMVKGWIADRLEEGVTPCWSCGATLDEFTVTSARHWCEPCAIKALKLLPKVLYHDCGTRECTHASEFVAAVRKRIMESKKRGDKKKQKVPFEASDTKKEYLTNDEKEGDKTGNDFPFTFPCARRAEKIE